MQRVLVVLPNWYGEVLFVTPFLQALRERWPKARITAMGWPQCRPILAHSPLVDGFIEFDERGKHCSIFAKARLVRELQREGFDSAFIVRKSLSRTLLLAAARIPVRIGFADGKSGWLLTGRAIPAGGRTHKAATYRPLLQLAGITSFPSTYTFSIADEERAFARRWMTGQGLMEGKPVVVLHAGANWDHKRWPTRRFAELGDRLASMGPMHIVVSAGPDDADLAAQIQRAMRAPASVWAGDATLREFAARLENASVVVANDTGILHLAAAIGRPVVGLYGPTSPEITGPLGPTERTIVIHRVGGCASVPCYRPDRPAHAGMEAITVDAVYQAVLRLIERCHGR